MPAAGNKRNRDKRICCEEAHSPFTHGASFTAFKVASAHPGEKITWRNFTFSFLSLDLENGEEALGFLEQKYISTDSLWNGKTYKVLTTSIWHETWGKLPESWERGRISDKFTWLQWNRRHLVSCHSWPCTPLQLLVSKLSTLEGLEGSVSVEGPSTIPASIQSKFDQNFHHSKTFWDQSLSVERFKKYQITFVWHRNEMKQFLRNRKKNQV